MKSINDLYSCLIIYNRPLTSLLLDNHDGLIKKIVAFKLVNTELLYNHCAYSCIMPIILLFLDLVEIIIILLYFLSYELVPEIIEIFTQKETLCMNPCNILRLLWIIYHFRFFINQIKCIYAIISHCLLYKKDQSVKTRKSFEEKIEEFPISKKVKQSLLK